MSWFLLTALLLHPVHETLSELEWNPKSERVEVALRLSLEDEDWIVRHHGPLPAGKEKRGDWYRDLLAAQMVFDPVLKTEDSPPRGRPIHWLGRKEEGAHVWWFFEVGGKKTPPKTLDMSLLFDRDTNYRHRVILLGNKSTGDAKKHRALELSVAKPRAQLDLVR
ncbi:MAG: DUF6702 family protein [Planctomycetota bacterium]